LIEKLTLRLNLSKIIIFSALSGDKVNWRNSFDFYIKNVDLIRKYNIEKDIHLEISYIKGALTTKQLARLKSKNIRVIELQIPKKLQNYEDHPSVQHGYQINEYLRRYFSSNCTYELFIIDPDFYVYGFSWIDKITKLAKKNKLDLIGIPYHEPFGFSGCYPTPFLINLQNLDSKFYDYDFLPNLKSLNNILKDDGSIKDDTKIYTKIKYSIRKEIGKYRENLVQLLGQNFVTNQISRFLAEIVIASDNFLEILFNFDNRQVRKKLITGDTGYLIRKHVHRFAMRSAIFKQVHLPKIVKNGVNYYQYLNDNPDVFKNRLNPSEHFWRHGIFEMRKPFKRTFFWRNKISCIPHKVREKFIYRTHLDKRYMLEIMMKLEKVNLLLTQTAFYNLGEGIVAFHIGSSKQRLFSDNLHELDLIGDTILSTLPR